MTQVGSGRPWRRAVRTALTFAAIVLVCLLAVPGLAAAQEISGTVTDTTGAVLPGVTVEAASPALIEKFVPSPRTIGDSTRSSGCRRASIP